MKAIQEGWDLVLLSLHSLSLHKVRSGLTALGILFGVWSVIAMLAINEGISRESQLALRELGSDNIIVTSIKPPQEQSKATAQQGGVFSYGLTDSDAKRLEDNLPGLVRCVPIRRTQKPAIVGAKNVGAEVFSTVPEFATVARAAVVSGRFLSPADMLPPSRPYCVLGEHLAGALFACRDPLGQTVILGGSPFVVIGVMDRLPSLLAGVAGLSGDYAIVPWDAAMDRFGRFSIQRSAGSYSAERVDVSHLILQMRDEEAVLQGAEVARTLLTRYHPDRPEFHVRVPLEEIELQKKQKRLWNLMFLVIASVSLLVGGIGIMNIMLANVTERTREIGIRRAVGASRSDIVWQFLLESVALTILGGLIGIAVGVGVPRVIEWTLGVKAVISAFTLILPFTMAVVVGLVSGFYPALRAAKLDPIAALRHE